jgi:hypothetical protein
VFGPEARRSDKTLITTLGPNLFRVRQILVDETEENAWYLEGEVDTSAGLVRDEPLLTLQEIRG